MINNDSNNFTTLLTLYKKRKINLNNHKSYLLKKIMVYNFLCVYVCI